MASSRNWRYVKIATGDGAAVLTAFVPVAVERKFLSLVCRANKPGMMSSKKN